MRKVSNRKIKCVACRKLIVKNTHYHICQYCHGLLHIECKGRHYACLAKHELEAQAQEARANVYYQEEATVT